MPLLLNIRHLETKAVQLDGEIPAAELELEGVDELIRVAGPLKHWLTVDRKGQNYLASGKLELPIECDCARCLKPFARTIELPEWTLLMERDGEDPVKIDGDFVDLTPYLREDILLAFPQHPLCEAGCGGLPVAPSKNVQVNGGAEPEGGPSSAWAELDKLKL
jgi:uncharacterized protein